MYHLEMKYSQCTCQESNLNTSSFSPLTLQSEVILNYELTFRNIVPVHMTKNLCTYSYITLWTIPAHFLKQFYEHYKSLLIMFIVTSTVLLYLVWSVSFQCVFFSYGVQKWACN